MKETCQSCKWWRGRRNGCSEGDCRRRSPGYQHRNPGHGKTSVWPTTEHKDWCGDYEKDVPEVAAEPRPDTKGSRVELAIARYENGLPNKCGNCVSFEAFNLSISGEGKCEASGEAVHQNSKPLWASAACFLGRRRSNQ